MANKTKSRSNISTAVNSTDKGTGYSKTDNGNATRAAVSEELFKKHVGIFGDQVAGRTAAVVCLLQSLNDKNIPFLILEPKEPRYADLLNCGATIKAARYAVGLHNAFAINALEILPQTNLDGHIANLVEIFQQLFDLDLPTTAILERALELTYTRRGWNLISGENKRVQSRAQYEPEIQPTLLELLESIDEAASQCGFDPAICADSLAQLRASIRPLVSGSRRAVFGMRTTTSVDELFKSAAVLELKHLPGQRERAFLTRLILAFLEEIQAAKNSRGELHHVLVVADYTAFHRTLCDSPRGAVFGKRLREFSEMGQALIFAGPSAEQLGDAGIKKLGTSVFTRENDQEELKQVGEVLKLQRSAVESVSSLNEDEALILSCTNQSEATKIVLGKTAVPEKTALSALNEEVNSSHSQGEPVENALLKPIFSSGACFAPEAFRLDAYLLGLKVSENAQFKEMFIRYVLSVLVDLTQLVHFRPRIMHEVHVVAGRDHGIPNHLVCWCALSLVADRYFADKAVEYNWSIANLHKVKDVWYTMMAPAFLPSMPNRKLDAGVIRSWIADFTALHKKENLPMPACGQCTNKCQF
ncbi:MAG TPA: hypothetical protein V6C72_10695, partial [Chroococcales cyanobacterium]